VRRIPPPTASSPPWPPLFFGGGGLGLIALSNTEATLATLEVAVGLSVTERTILQVQECPTEPCVVGQALAARAER